MKKTPISPGRDGWAGDEYQARFDQLSASGVNVHGEADFVVRFNPVIVLDAGCGTGRVALELARRGIETVGVDRDASMINTARRLGPELEWHVADIDRLDLGRDFDLVLMAGNVPLFTPPGTQAKLVAGCARHLDAGSILVAGFQLGSGYALTEYDEHCKRAGLDLENRWSSWDCIAFSTDDSYAVSVHRRGLRDRKPS